MKSPLWPAEWQELARYIPDVEKLFGLPAGPYEDPSISVGDDFIARFAKWPAFKKRNVYSLLRSRIDKESGPEVWINATATQFVVQEGQLKQVTAESGEGDTIEVRAKQVVICAGAIESTRLLLLIQHQNPGSLAATGLGEGLHDHLSAVVAEIEVKDRKTLNRLVGFRFPPGGGMRNLRFELAPETQLRNELPPCFAHIGFSDSNGGFSAVRDIYRALQKRQFPAGRTIWSLLAGVPWLVRAVWWRFVHRRLLFPDNAVIQLHMVIEQKPVASNRITLSAAIKDNFNQPIARIDWQVFQQDAELMGRTVSAFSEAWAKSRFSDIGSLKLYTPDQITSQMKIGGGIFHPGGSIAPFREDFQGCINSNQRVFNCLNLAILSTATFPTGGGANPTMMLMLQALRYVRLCRAEH